MALMATVIGSERLRMSCNQAQLSVLKTSNKLPEQSIICSPAFEFLSHSPFRLKSTLSTSPNNGNTANLLVQKLSACPLHIVPNSQKGLTHEEALSVKSLVLVECVASLGFLHCSRPISSCVGVE